MSTDNPIGFANYVAKWTGCGILTIVIISAIVKLGIIGINQDPIYLLKVDEGKHLSQEGQQLASAEDN